MKLFFRSKWLLKIVPVFFLSLTNIWSEEFNPLLVRKIYENPYTKNAIFIGPPPIRDHEFVRDELLSILCPDQSEYQLTIFSVASLDSPIFEIEKCYFEKHGTHPHYKFNAGHAIGHDHHLDLFYCWEVQLIDQSFTNDATLVEAQKLVADEKGLSFHNLSLQMDLLVNLPPVLPRIIYIHGETGVQEALFAALGHLVLEKGLSELDVYDPDVLNSLKWYQSFLDKSRELIRQTSCSK